MFIERLIRLTVKREPRLGKVLLISEQGCLRDKWRLGRVSELIKGTDRLVRAAKSNYQVVIHV